MKFAGKVFWTDCIKTVIVALIFSSVVILGLSLLIGFVPLSDKLLVAVNQGVKAVSLLLASLLCFKDKSKGIPKGLIVGVVYALLGWLLFGSVQNSLSFSLSTLADVGLGAVMGMLAGVFSVVFGKKSVSRE